MRKLLLFIAFLAAAALPARAQVYVFNSGIIAGGQMSIVKVSVIDSLSKDPLPYASVYLTEKKDTTITHFALTDTLGAVSLREVPFGEYKFHVEMMGFKPYSKEIYFRRAVEDMGIVQMQVDDEFIRAAMISDIGNPIVIKQDTIEYHAAAFLQDKNAVLKDLLTRMPGIDISDNGKVRVNGEEVSRITVNGKTFFFEDQSMALNNLPASIVDKIRVIDKKSDEERVTGIADGKRTKEVDVALKKEYEDGWFGNVAAKGGTTMDFSDNELRDDRGLLYSVKSMVSTYNPKDQLTFVGNASNISDGGQTFVTEDGQTFTFGGGGGLTTSAQLGVNAVTTRVKDIELAASTSYNYSGTKSASKTLRTTFQEEGDMLSESTDKGFRQGNSIGANASVRKEQGNFKYTVGANFNRSESHYNAEADTRTTRETMMLNSSARTAGDDGIRKSFGTYASGGYSGIGGNPMRSITGNIHLSFDKENGTSQEYSNTITGATPQIIDLHYNRFRKANMVGASLSYTEPFGKKFRLQAQTSFSGSWDYSLRDAFNADGSANDYYTTLSDSRYLKQSYGATGSYISNGWQFGLGASAEGIQNRLFSRAQTVEALTGEEWIWRVIPRVNISYFKESTNIYFFVSGSQGQPSGYQMMPTLNVSNPTQISAGNIYLRPFTSLYSSLSLRKGFPKKFSSMNASLSYSMTLHPVITAFWYDTHGVQYYVPVNAERPRSSVGINAGYNAPLNKERTLSMEVALRGSYSNSLGYRASRPIEPLEAGHTDYSAFMEQFWGGDASGERFYSGASGFEENNTDNYYTNERIHIKYNKHPWSMTVGFTNGFSYAHFSTPGSQDVITTENRIGMSGSYTTPHKFRIWTELNYNFFTGYAEGYGRPEWHWDQSIAKDIGTFTLSISAHDILGQMRNLSHIDAADYMQDSYRLILGRYVMFGIKWNFGKMNSVQNRRAQQAQDMMFF